MRYKAKLGLVNHIKTMFENVVYVNNVDDAFARFEEMMAEPEVKEDSIKSTLVAINTTKMDPGVLKLSPYEKTRGRFQHQTSDTLKGIATLEYDMGFDITILTTDSYINDTLVEELLFRLSYQPDYEYGSGLVHPASLEDEEFEFMLKGTIRMDNGLLGEFQEAVTTEDNGRIYRTTFSITVSAHSLKDLSTKLALTIPVMVDDLI